MNQLPDWFWDPLDEPASPESPREIVWPDMFRWPGSYVLNDPLEFITIQIKIPPGTLKGDINL